MITLLMLPSYWSPLQIKYGADKVTPEEVVRLVAGLTTNANGLIDFQTKVNMFVAK